MICHPTDWRMDSFMQLRKSEAEGVCLEPGHKVAHGLETQSKMCCSLKERKKAIAFSEFTTLHSTISGNTNMMWMMSSLTFWRRNSTTAICPWAAAHIRGVKPSSSVWLITFSIWQNTEINSLLTEAHKKLRYGGHLYPPVKGHHLSYLEINNSLTELNKCITL